MKAAGTITCTTYHNVSTVLIFEKSTEGPNRLRSHAVPTTMTNVMMIARVVANERFVAIVLISAN